MCGIVGLIGRIKNEDLDWIGFLNKLDTETPLFKVDNKFYYPRMGASPLLEDFFFQEFEMGTGIVPAQIQDKTPVSAKGHFALGKKTLVLDQTEETNEVNFEMSFADYAFMSAISLEYNSSEALGNLEFKTAEAGSLYAIFVQSITEDLARLQVQNLDTSLDLVDRDFAVGGTRTLTFDGITFTLEVESIEAVTDTSHEVIVSLVRN